VPLDAEYTISSPKTRESRRETGNEGKNRGYIARSLVLVKVNLGIRQVQAALIKLKKGNQKNEEENERR